MPFWEPAFSASQTAMNSLAGSLSYIRASFPRTQGSRSWPDHLGTAQPGASGNVTLVEEPPLFYIYRHQLYQYTNDTIIQPIHAVNVTGVPNEPLQLVAGDDARGLTGGQWRWAGTRLMYDHYGRSNRGTYYACAFENGGSGVFMNMQPGKPPKNCSAFQLVYMMQKTEGEDE
ncbi:hypothetical protein BD626DRAFT_564505 [Schizophyllum amplum]|uniref:Uncharacterized protein n=1 Tax=Schizophyllum amplum TaxID=97359 RepID=A0A550CS31_9AGAR|nr:hypothetical protein BD626DRAFT_564505 [Auriculariopsis ampla]